MQNELKSLPTKKKAQKEKRQAIQDSINQLVEKERQLFDGLDLQDKTRVRFNVSLERAKELTEKMGKMARKPRLSNTDARDLQHLYMSDKNIPVSSAMSASFDRDAIDRSDKALLDVSFFDRDEHQHVSIFGFLNRHQGVKDPSADTAAQVISTMDALLTAMDELDNVASAPRANDDATSVAKGIAASDSAVEKSSSDSDSESRQEGEEPASSMLAAAQIASEQPGSCIQESVTSGAKRKNGPSSSDESSPPSRAKKAKAPARKASGGGEGESSYHAGASSSTSGSITPLCHPLTYSQVQPVDLVLPTGACTATDSELGLSSQPSSTASSPQKRRAAAMASSPDAKRAAFAGHSRSSQGLLTASPSQALASQPSEAEKQST